MPTLTYNYANSVIKMPTLTYNHANSVNKMPTLTYNHANSVIIKNYIQNIINLRDSVVVTY